jgi:hypothetical protein
MTMPSTNEPRSRRRGEERAAGDVQVFVHGEASAVKQLREHLFDERALPRERVSISGYWRRGADEDTFQAEARSLSRSRGNVHLSPEGLRRDRPAGDLSPDGDSTAKADP